MEEKQEGSAAGKGPGLATGTVWVCCPCTPAATAHVKNAYMVSVTWSWNPHGPSRGYMSTVQMPEQFARANSIARIWALPPISLIHWRSQKKQCPSYRLGDFKTNPNYIVCDNILW